ncbi:Putative Poly(A) polymerase [[Torrubiella] hemipterigena]|uniref:Putative Poly(A) polymerase n=1 Tax=[Torrubiella] hemipterigena TaxID=1531966 RepID=A0A0A1TQ70_9HYPO|nr:Putative Poly(A) polymerase [[Torrubiella] hemipterigena]
MCRSLEKKIELLPAEQVLREFLLEAAQEVPNLEIWITGGWVRDRLLGLPSSDLDFALNNLTGREFGKFLASFSTRPEIQSKYSQKADNLGIPGSRSVQFTIIERNAEMAKQLETARGSLFGLDIDLVNLRKEIYNGQSRTPRMDFGTPEEDALRRDATVNALFFHLEKQEVIDLTGKGLKDLQARIMRTPLDPYQTFMDDPLRVLRLIRLSSKLGFDIDSQTQASIGDHRVQQALDKIITRDRINIEVFKMMRDTDPATALEQIFQLRLFVPVFLRFDSPLLAHIKNTFPFKKKTLWPATWPRAYSLLTKLLQLNSHLGLMVQSAEDVESIWVMAICTPIAGFRHGRLQEAVQDVTNALRLPVKITRILESALQNYDSISNVVESIVTNRDKPPLPSVVGMAIRSWGSTWQTQLVYVLLAQAVHTQSTSTPPGFLDFEAYSRPKVEEHILDRFSVFVDYIWAMDLQNAHLKRPLLDGNQIQNHYGLLHGGKYLKNAIDGLIAWQFDHSNASVEEAKVWLLQERDTLGIPPSET